MQTAFAEYIGQLNPASPCHTETVGDVAEAIHHGGAVLAWKDGVAVGSARYAFYNDAFYVGRVSVLPDYRGMGVASAMMKRLEAIAREYGYEQMQLCSRMNLPKNIALYERLGFQIVRSQQISPDADVQVTMVKPLETAVLEPF
jgi:ribosomal protein S18 acetylase RimI-like enzyme